MANQQQFVSVLPATGGADSIDKGPFLLNTLIRRDGHEVRPGFGQLGQWNLTNTHNVAQGGFTRQLGSTAIVTDFGHTQVVSLWVARMALRQNETAQVRTLNVTQDGVSDVFVLQVYDVTTNQRWEEVLYLHTGDRGSDAIPMPYWRPHYTGRSRWLLASDESSCFFVSAFGVLFFGNESMGTWCYTPADYRDQMAHTTTQRAGMGTLVLPNDWRGESCRVWRLNPVPFVKTGISYIGNDQFPSPVDACLWGERIVYAFDRTLYFSDPLYPASVATNNLVTLSLMEPITAVAETAGIILVFTRNETWAFRPSSGASAAAGDARRLSDSIGCLGPLAKARRMETLIWADDHGIFSFDGGMQIREVSEPIRGLFDEGMSLPLSRYYDTAGIPQSATSANSSFVQWTGLDRINVAYNPLYDVALFALPNQNVALCLSQGKSWSLWSWESFAVNAGAPLKTLPEPYVCNAVDSLFLSVGPIATTCKDDSGATYSTGSNAVLLWREGGALDRNTAVGSDQRFGSTYIRVDQTSANNGWFYVGDPTLVRQGSLLGTTYAAQDTWMFPVYLCPSDTPVDGVKFHFTYDDTAWTPIYFDDVNKDVDYDLPAQRLPARDAFGYSAINVGSNEVRVYGNELRINAIGATAAATWTHHPSFNMTPGSLEPFIWLPFKCTTGTIGQIPSLGLITTTASIIYLGAPVTQKVYVATNSAPLVEESISPQPVDWCIKGSRAEVPDRGQARIRGLFLRARSLGEPVSVADQFVHGLLNATFQTDMREWTSQLADYTLGLGVAEKANVRARMLGITSAVNLRTFGNVATWSSTSATSTGNFLIDDEQVDTRTVSLTARGETLTAMLFGHVRDKAQAMIIDSMDIAVRAVGQARRWGR